MPLAPLDMLDMSPQKPFFAIGDIHGCKGQLDTLLAKIKHRRPDDAQLIFIGDVIDRGSHSAQALKLVFEMVQNAPETTTLLMGNHEKMLLEFIDDPAGRGLRWIANGGIETLASFGITGLPRNLDAEDATEAADALESAMPSGMQDWLRALPLQWSSGNVHCVHAAMNPDRSPEDQSERSLIWGHPEFLSRARDDGQFVVHGHTIVPRPAVNGTRVSIDTGAYKNRPLTAVHVSQGQVEFLQA